MWEHMKERGYGLATLGVLTSNLVTFSIMAVYGVYQIWEPWRWLLYVEAGLCLLLIIWGIERYIKDIMRHRLHLKTEKAHRLNR